MHELLSTLQEMIDSAPRIVLEENSKILIVSDLHIGDGSAGDDFLGNEQLFLDALDGFYLREGWTVVLNGDIEELHKYKHRDILAAHAGFYRRLGELASAGRLHKLVGNHDLALLARKDHPFQLGHALALQHGSGLFVCLHGHQVSNLFSKHNYLSGFIVRYLARPLRIKNSDRTSKSQLRDERRLYKASKALGIACISGHTHIPLFESLDKRDWLRFSLERLLEDHADARGPERDSLEEEIHYLARELRRLSRKRPRGKYRLRSFFETDGLPIPCLFNSGCLTARGSFTAVEI